MQGLSSLRFHHFGLAVRDDTAALAFLRAQGLVPGERVYDPNQNVYVRLCTADHHPTVEIVQPGEGKSPIDSLIRKYNELFYHSCYEVDDLDATLAAIRALGIDYFTIAERKPAPLFGGRHVSFHQLDGYGIVEFLETE